MERATTTPNTAELARGGPIAFMASHPIAANLLMVFLLLAGLFAAGDLVQEMLPDASLDLVQVVVPYPGAAPEEVESAIVRKIEEEIGSLDGVTRIEASASEGLGSVIAEFKTGTDISRALNDVKARVDRIPSFPAGAERPEVREITSRQSVIRLIVHGDVPERALKELAYRIEDGLSSLPEVSYVETSGVREYEISIEVPSHRLRALGLTLEDIADAVRRGSTELSAGKISTGEEEIRVRTIGQNYDQYDFEGIIVLSRPDGTSLRLRDIAELRDGFADTDLITRFNGNRAVRVDVSRTADEQVLAGPGARAGYRGGRRDRGRREHLRRAKEGPRRAHDGDPGHAPDQRSRHLLRADHRDRVLGPAGGARPLRQADAERSHCGDRHPLHFAGGITADTAPAPFASSAPRQAGVHSGWPMVGAGPAFRGQGSATSDRWSAGPGATARHGQSADCARREYRSDRARDGSGRVGVRESGVPSAGRGRCHSRELRVAHRDARRTERGSGCATGGCGTSCRGPVGAGTVGWRRCTPVEHQRHRGRVGRTVQSPAGQPDDASARPYRSCPVCAAGGGGLHRQRIRAGVAGRGGNAAGSEVSRFLVRRIDGVFDIRSNRDDGFRELQLELKPAARSLGLTRDDLARQVRSAFFGAEALRVLRGREDMRVYVRLPEEERNSVADIDNYVVRTAGGAEIPLGHVASAHFTRSSTAIYTIDGQRAITVTANVDSRIATGQQVSATLESEVLESLAAAYPGFSYEFGGEQRQQRQIVSALSGSLIVVFLIMFALLAIPFGSYSQPLIIMAAIPLGFVGAVLGHLLLGLSFGFMSLQGLVGCFGVVVNDSLVMISFINEKRDAGLEPREAIIVGTKARVRAVLLTSVTTFLGVAPLVFERDPAAQHLVPVAAALAFGILVATPFLMLVVPALAMSQFNLQARLRGRSGRGR